MKRAAATAPTADQLRACTSREAAAALLPAALTVPQLKAIATDLEIPALSRFRTKAALTTEIVQTAVGRRADGQAILNSRSDRPIPTDAVNLRPVPAYARRRPTADDLLALAAAIQRGEVTDPAVLADIAAAAADLLAAAAPAAPTADDRAAALQAIRDLNRPTGWTSITDLRTRLPYMTSADQDALMKGLLRDGLVDIIPSGNLKPLTDDDHTAALMLGGQWTHAIRVRPVR